MLNALTVDLEDWYQGLTSTGRQVERWPAFEDRVVASTGRLLDVLSVAGVRATFFVLRYVAGQFPELVQEVAAAGHEIGLHGGRYHEPVSRMTPAQFRAEVSAGRDIVEKAGGQPVAGYRAAMFSVNRSALWALDVLEELGFRYDSSVFPTRNPLYGFPGAPRFPHRPVAGGALVEYPPSTARVLGVNVPVAGGFYLRALPYGLVRRGLEQINRDEQPAIVYVHPWELDPEQPRPHPTPRERVTHYYNLRRTESKLRALLGDFRFGTLAEVDARWRGKAGWMG